MCGLVALFSKKNKAVGQQVFELYKKQKERGQKGFGYLAIDKDGHLLTINRSVDEYGIKKLLMKEKAPNILFHHRWPTSTKNTIGTTHPMFVSHEELEHDYYFAHNGGVTNCKFLKEKHNKLGYVYSSEFKEHTVAKYADGEEEVLEETASVFNDSEALAIELARYIDGVEEKVNTFGAAAFWGISLEKGTNKVLNVFYGKNLGRSLMNVKTKKHFGFSSTTGSDMDTMKLFTMNLDDKIVTDTELHMERSAAPVKRTMGYTWNHNKPNNAVVNTYENALENKHYSFNEACDSGVPLSEFISVSIDHTNWHIPSKFAGKTDGRKAPPTQLQIAGVSPYKEVDEGLDEKGKGLLEEFCTKYAKLKLASEDNEDEYNAHLLDVVEYRKEETRLEALMVELDEKILCLNAEQEEVDDMMDICEQMEQYNRSYSIDDIGIIR